MIFFSGTIIFITPDRLPYIEYLSCPLEVKLAFVFRDPPLTYVSNIYYLPFTGVVWICAISLVILSTIIIYVTYLFAKEKKKQNHRFTTSDFMLFAISTVCQMGSQLSPKRASSRIAMVMEIINCD